MTATSPRNGPPYLLLLGLLIALALAVRWPLVGLGSDSPRRTESYNIEEAENVRISTRMLHQRTLNPHAFEYPSLFYYLSLAVETALERAGLGTWPRYAVGVRCIALGFGLAAVALAAALARRVGGPWAGLLAAAIVALDRTQIEMSTVAKPNAAQIAFILAGFLALGALAARPRLRPAVAAAVLFGLAAASKWLGALGLAGLAVAPVLGQAVSARAGVARARAALASAWQARLTAAHLALPFALFAATFLAAVPFALLSPREFAFGLGQVFTAQAIHRLALPVTAPLVWASTALGPAGTLLAVAGVGLALVRLPRWDGSSAENLRVLVLGWTLAYGALVLFVFVRLPSYVDLWTPFLAILAGTSVAAIPAALRSRGAPALLALTLAIGLWTNAGHGWARAAREPRDTRASAAAWLAARAQREDPVLADLGVFVPDSFTHVAWNWWGSPPRVVYDETATWGRDPAWPEWYGGHRRLLFVNAKWTHPESLLARRPRWVVTTDAWEATRARPGGASETQAAGFDRALADGSAGYAERARFTPEHPPDGRPLELRSSWSGARWTGGYPIRIYERLR